MKTKVIKVTCPKGGDVRLPIELDRAVELLAGKGIDRATLWVTADSTDYIIEIYDMRSGEGPHED